MFEIAIRCGSCRVINKIELSAPEMYPDPLVEFDCQSCKCPLFVLRRILATVAGSVPYKLDVEEEAQGARPVQHLRLQA